MDDASAMVHLQRAKAGNREALGTLLDSFRTYLHLMAVAELDPELRAKISASDVVQETLLEAHRDFPSFAGEGEAAFSAWLRQILLNNLANLRRHYLQTKQRCVGCETSLDSGESWNQQQALADSSATPRAKAEAREEDQLLDDALSQLPVEYQQVIRLRHEEGLPFQEIGERLGRSAEAARKLWSRAIERLQQQLSEESRG